MSSFALTCATSALTSVTFPPDAGRRRDRTGTDRARSQPMNDERRAADKLSGIEGTDAAALGTESPPESAPASAEVDDEENVVPGADFGFRPAVEDKPWFTTLSAESDQAGVGNDPPDAQDPNYTPTDEEPG